MCHAIVRILFKGNDRQVVPCETERDLETKVAGLKDNEQVVEFTVFNRGTKYRKAVVWEEFGAGEAVPSIAVEGPAIGELVCPTEGEPA